MELKKLHQNILELCMYDYTELWLIIVRVSQDSYPTGKVSDSIYQTTIKEVREMLESGLFEAGHLTRENDDECFNWRALPVEEVIEYMKNHDVVFTPLDLPVDEAIEYIKSEWEKLDGEAPHVGHICWFRATPAGEKLAKELKII